LIGGQRVLPDKAQSSGFKFRHEKLRDAFAALFCRPMADLRDRACAPSTEQPDAQADPQSRLAEARVGR